MTPNEWEQVKSAGDDAIRRWIAKEMRGKSCLVVLIGARTASRRWVQYEIKKAWDDGLGVFGVHIHKLLDRTQTASAKGANPLAEITVPLAGGQAPTGLDLIAQAHDPAGVTSTGAHRTIANGIAAWADEAVSIRAKYP